jgi:hypothetical protein
VVERSSPGKALFHPEAETEYLEALAYYRLHAPGVVEAFETDVRDAVAHQRRRPGYWIDRI